MICGGLEGCAAEHAPSRVANGAGRAGCPPGLSEDGCHGLGIARPQALVGLRELGPASVLLHSHVEAVQIAIIILDEIGIRVSSFDRTPELWVVNYCFAVTLSSPRP